MTRFFSGKCRGNLFSNVKAIFDPVKQLLLLTILLLPGIPGRAQSPQADSLFKVLQQAPPDTQRVVALVNYAWEIGMDMPQDANQYLWEAVALAQKLKFPKGESAAWNALGVTHEILDSLPKAIEYYKIALGLRERLRDQRGIAAQYNNLGNVYEMMGAYEQALTAHRESLRIVEELGDSVRIARSHLNLGSLFENMGLYPEAYEQTNAARQIFEARGDNLSLAKAFTTLGHIRFELEMFKEAHRWYTEALRLKRKQNDPDAIAFAMSDLGNALDEMGELDSSKVAIQLYHSALAILEKLNDQSGMATLYNNLGVAYKHLNELPEAMRWLEKSRRIRQEQDDSPGLMEVYNGIGDVYLRQKNYKKALEYTTLYGKIAEALGNGKFVQKSYKDLAKIYADMGKWELAYIYREKYDDLRYKRLDEARSTDFERKEVVFNDGRKQREIERQEQELKEAKTRALALIAGALVLFVLVGLLYNRSRIRARANRELAAKNDQIQQERERADNLLKNILPEKTAQELKLYDSVQPVRYDAVTVLFSDFKNFTQIAEQLTPEELVAELDLCFRLFDHIVAEYGLEKIKTIGDAYMCAGGLPEPSATHAIDTVRAAIEMQHGLRNLMEKNALDGRPVFEMRIGIHSGPVVAGVVGSRKFAYDIWGDTVNTAARLEQGGEPGKINISETTWKEIQKEIGCTYRGKLSAKNKGEIDMYFVEYDG
jgi:class 3 adenylate cyclase